jgi:hypothetical protein
MRNSFMLELDTTPPVVQILAPRYTTKDTETEILVVADEDLAVYQDIYIIDNKGVRHDFTFYQEGRELLGLVFLRDLPHGIATIYARLRDEVHNLSSLASRTIRILQTSELLIDIEISEYPALVDIIEMTQLPLVSEFPGLIDVVEIIQEVETRERELDGGE